MAVHVGVRGPGHLSRVFGGFSPASLFTGGQLGAWYDPSDLTSMFQDTAGTTPAAVDSPVGKINDKSGNGYHLTQGTSSARPILRLSSGLYYLELDGVDDCLLASGAGLDLFKSVGVGSLFAGYAPTSIASSLRAFFGWSINASVSTRLALFQDLGDFRVGGRRLDADSFASVGQTGGMTANVAVIASGLFDWSSATVTARKNRALVAGPSAFQTSGSTTNASSNAGGIGFQGSGTPVPGKFYGGIALQRVPTATEQTNIENYIGAKCGV